MKFYFTQMQIFMNENSNGSSLADLMQTNGFQNSNYLFINLNCREWSREQSVKQG